MSPFSAFLAVIAGAAGVACLYGSWRRFLPGRGWPVVVGWLLVGLSGFFWMRASGAEFGIAYAILAAGVVAWLLVGFNAQVRRSKERNGRTADKVTPGGAHRLSRHAVLFLATVPLSAAAGMFASVALARLLPWSAVNEMVLAVFLMPVLWGAAAYWAVADPKAMRPLAGLAVGGLLGAALVYLG